MIDNKCYKCDKRQVGCHSTCIDYKRYKTELEKEKAKERLDIIIRQYDCDKHENFLRRNKDLRGK